MKFSRLTWTAWALVPVGGLAFHYGPGQAIYQHEVAISLRREAGDLEQQAAKLQASAYAAHLAAIDARRRVFLSPSPDADVAMRAATDAESAAFKVASDAWLRAADAYGRIVQAAQGASDDTLRKVRWSRARAMVRAGDIWRGIDEFESLLTEDGSSGRPDAELDRAVREELAAAYYYGARLMRLSGEPPEEWMIESGKARQNFRFLAEQARDEGLASRVVENQERNVELVLDLEQSTQLQIEGKPLPRESPLGRIGNRPGRAQGKRKQPPQQRDGRGAGGAEDITTGW